MGGILVGWEGSMVRSLPKGDGERPEFEVGLSVRLYQ
jgi:hypothetical protein